MLSLARGKERFEGYYSEWEIEGDCEFEVGGC